MMMYYYYYQGSTRIRFKPHGGIYNVDIYFSFNDLNSFDLITHIILKNCDPISTIYKCPLW